MEETNDIKHFDAVIIGAGPAGLSCALSLVKSGLKIAIVDKQSFPRDKICGDAIPGRAVKVLKEILPGFEALFSDFKAKRLIRESIIYYNGRSLHHEWKLEAYTCRRLDFDNFLFSLLKQKQMATVYEGTEITEVLRTGNDWNIHTKDDNCLLSARIIIGADGVNGITARKLSGNKPDRSKHISAIRSYYKGIDNAGENCTEFFLDSRYFPGYFWIFPMQAGLFNTGFGMVSEYIAKRGLNLKKEFYEFIKRSDVLTARFKDAVQQSPPEAYGIPLGPRAGAVTGDGFLLTGDAASLVDPLSGDGIGNAVLSGKLAAEQVIRCFSSSDFSKHFMMKYERELSLQLGPELRKNSMIRKLITAAPLIQSLFLLGGKRTLIRNTE